MARFKITEKHVTNYNNGRPGYVEREFRTWDTRSVVVGIGVHGGITNLGLRGSKLDEATGALFDPKNFGSFDPHELQALAPPGPPCVITGIGLKGDGNNITGLTVWTLDISHGIPAGSPPHLVPGPPAPHLEPAAPGVPMAPPGGDGPGHGTGGGSVPPVEPPPGAIRYVVGDEFRDKTAMLTSGYLPSGFSIQNVRDGWVEWGRLIHGVEVSAEGMVDTISVSAYSQRVDFTLTTDSTGPLQWYFNLDSSAMTQMLLLGHIREATLHGRKVACTGVSWQGEPAAEVEGVTLFGG